MTQPINFYASQFPVSIKVEPKNMPNSGHYRGGVTVTRSLNHEAYQDAFYANAPDDDYWWHKGAKALDQLDATYGTETMEAWCTLNILATDTHKAAYEKMLAVLKCQHEHTHADTQGRMHFAGGEVWDTLHDVTICDSCLMVIGKPANKEIEF